MLITDIIFRVVQAVKNRVDLYAYRRQIPKLVSQIRAKEKIKVLFVLSDLSLWKTESLYKAMLEHPRFEPIIGTTLLTCDTPSEIIRKYSKLTEFLNLKGYSYVELDSNILTKIKPDITFYQQPYESFISSTVSFQQIIKQNLLICDCHYAFRTLAVIPKNSWVIDLSLYRYCWQMYMENKLNLEYGKLSIVGKRNLIATGMPWQDELMKSKEFFNDPWKPQSKLKKRIIYAPHHTLPDTSNLLNLSCFLDVCDYMLELAKSFSDSVQFAFKPHPFLKKKLISRWGEDKVKQYYDKWNLLDNCQLVEDGYLDLFKHSDALIHDCDSFTLEYCFIKKPVLFLIHQDNIDKRKSDLNKFGQMAFDLHDKGFYKQDIYNFILSVIGGTDKHAPERDKFYQTALVPPHGNLAVDNIINSIIG